MAINVFEKGGLLDRYLSDYQERPGQIKMSRLIFDVLHNPDPDAPNVVIAEGPVGVGKSFAYLFPALLDPVEERLIRGKVIVSTSSITLQNQLEKKDLPFVRDVIKNQLDQQLTFATLKGISNYICLYNFYQFESQLSPELRNYVNDQIVFGKTPEYKGSLGEKPEQVDPVEWEMITVDTNECAGRDCPLYRECFYQRQKRKASDADVIVINHALFAANWYLKSIVGTEGILPEARFWIFDECHELEDSMANFFSVRLSETVLRRMVSGFTRMIGQLRKKWMEEERILDEDELETYIQRWNERLNEVGLEGLIHFIEEVCQQNPEGLIRKEYPEVTPWIEKLTKFWVSLDSLVLTRYDEDILEEVEFKPECVARYARHVWDIIVRLDWLRQKPEGVAIYTEVSSTGKPVIVMTSINIAEILAPFWVSSNKRFVLTSATCSVDRDFSFLCQRLGIEKSQVVSGIFESPFNYETQGVLVVPYHFDPKNTELFDQQVLYGIDQIVRFGSQNNIFKTMILFTSYRQMDNLVPYIKLMFQGQFDVFDQNPGMSKEFLIKKFQESSRAILVAQAASFGTGVDVKGNKNVIIVKLSFDVPTNPLFVARSEVIESKGGNAFVDLSIPTVIIRTKQQLGRSIRSIHDRAIIAIFDGRLNKTQWGQKILSSLPPMQRMIVKDWTPEAVKDWIAKIRF